MAELSESYRPGRGRSVGVGLVVAAWLSTTLLLVEPLQAAWANWEELSVGLPTILRRLSPVLLVGFLASGLLALVTCWLAPLRGPALWVALGVSVWAQADLFAWQYGTFDGAPIDWSAHAAKAGVEAGVWLGLPLLALWRAGWVARNALRIVAGVFVLQLAGLAGALVENWPLDEKAPPAESVPFGPISEYATLSTRANAIVIVVDMVQSDMFAEAIESEELRSALPEGFIYYRNAISLYTSTQFSAQSILSGRAVPDDTDAANWLKRAISRSLPVLLAEEGYDTELASIALHTIGCPWGLPGVRCRTLWTLRTSDLEEAKASAWRSEVSLLARLAAFRAAPHVLKRRVYDAGEWHLPAVYPLPAVRNVGAGVHRDTQTDLAVLDALTARVRGEDGPPRFRFLHLFGAHFPAVVDERCERRPEGDWRGRTVATVRCMTRQLSRLFEAIEAAGVYDESVIVVVSDHGFPNIPLDPSRAEPPLPAGGSSEAEALYGWSRGVPLFLLKPRGARGPLRISDRPVSLCDVPATIVDALDLTLDLQTDCETVLSAERVSPRLHYRYPGYRAQKRRPRARRYFFDFEAFRVDGHSWRADSWVRVDD